MATSFVTRTVILSGDARVNVRQESGYLVVLEMGDRRACLSIEEAQAVASALGMVADEMADERRREAQP